MAVDCILEKKSQVIKRFDCLQFPRTRVPISPGGPCMPSPGSPLSPGGPAGPGTQWQLVSNCRTTYNDICGEKLTLKLLGHFFFQNIISFPNVSQYKCNIFSWIFPHRRQGPIYAVQSITLLMSWLLVSPGHQQPWYWSCFPRILRFQSLKG